MKKYIQNEKGLTLVEMLAVIIIGAILIVLISNTHLFSQKQFNSQSEKTGQLFNVTYAAKVITKEIRKAKNVKLEDNLVILKLDKGNETIFEFQYGEILMNSRPLVSGISKFEVTSDVVINRKLNIIIESIEQNKGNESVVTDIYLREGVSIEIN